MVLNIPMVLKISPHGIEHPPRYCTHIIQGENSQPTEINGTLPLMMIVLQMERTKKIEVKKHCLNHKDLTMKSIKINITDLLLFFDKCFEILN